MFLVAEHLTLTPVPRIFFFHKQQSHFVKQFLNIGILLCTHFHTNLSLDIYLYLFSLLVRYLDKVNHITFVADQSNHARIEVKILRNLLVPGLNSVERLRIGHVVHKNNAHSILNVHLRQREEFLLPCRVPEVHLKLLFVARYFQNLRAVVSRSVRYAVLDIVIVDHSVEDRRLAHCGVS